MLANKNLDCFTTALKLQNEEKVAAVVHFIVCAFGKV